MVTPLRIGIDARPLRWPGIGRHVRELVAQLAEIDTRDQFLAYCDSEQSAAPFRDKWPNVRVVMMSSGLYSIAEQIELPWRILRDRLDLFHATSSLVVPLFHPCRLVVTVHDLLLKTHPEHLPSRLAGIYFSIMNAAALGSAAQLLTVSDFTRDVLGGAYPAYRAKTRTVHNGVSAAFHPVRDETQLRRVKLELGLGERYLLYVGTYKKHKNVPLLVEAYAGLPPELRANCRLLLLAPRDPRFTEADALIDRHGLRGDVVQVERVAEDDLIALYSGAEAIVSPSDYEGFGFAVLEAMACHAAVVATRIPAFAEVAGDAAMLVEPGDRLALTAALRRILGDHELRDRHAALGYERSHCFSWRKAAEQTLLAYRDALAGKRC